MLVGVLGVLGFVLLARPEPSVLRAAAMGTVALAGMGSRGRDRGVRALGVAVFVLLLLDPWLALSVGFVLSSLATAGILFLGPPFRDALATWLPRWAAEALAVPFAAQLACTPVVAAISGQVSLVAVVANLVVAAAVGPATVLGLLGGVADAGAATAGTRLRSDRGPLRLVDHHRRGAPRAAADRLRGLVGRGDVGGRARAALRCGGPRGGPGAAPGPLVDGAERGAGGGDAAPAAVAGLAAARLGPGRLRHRAG